MFILQLSTVSNGSLSSASFRVSAFLRVLLLAGLGGGAVALTGCSNGGGAKSAVTVATPVISPAGSTYSAPVTIAMADATAGATIYYTVDGTTPKSSSTKYTAPFQIAANTTVQAIATAPGYTDSAAVSASFVFALPTATPVFSPLGGTYTTTQSVTITDATAGAAIYYTLDGTAPSVSSPQYTGPIAIAANATVNAIAVAPGAAASNQASAVYVITPPAALPLISPATGTYLGSQQVTISDATPGATIYYTEDATVPTSTSATYTAPFTVSANETVSAVAIAPGYSTSPLAQSIIKIVPPAAVPVFTPAAGTFTSAQTVALATTTPGADIYYTTDGSQPTTSSTKYTGPIAVTTSETLSAIATGRGTGSTDSPVATASYTILLASLQGQVITGTVSDGKAVSGATVQLYAAGNTGYGSAATGLSPVAETTDANGKFTLNFNCPSPAAQVYVLATGGDPGLAAGSSNPSIGLMTGLGRCDTITSTTFVTMNEATTVATAAALAPFMTSSTNLGTTSANALGLSNAMLTIPNLVTPSNGVTLGITPGGNGTLPQGKVDTLANVLASCTATDGTGTGCSSLFSNATPAGGTLPANTADAAIAIARNPGKNVADLYALGSATGPFQPALSADSQDPNLFGPPSDWTFAIQFTSPSPGDPTTPNGNPFPNDIAVDAQGYIWLADLAVHGFIEFGPNGSVLSGANAFSGDQMLFGLGGVAIDLSGNAWVGGGISDPNGNSAGSLYEFGPDGTAKSPALGYYGGGLSTPVQIAFDGSGNAWVLDSRQNFDSVFKMIKVKPDGTQISGPDGFGAGNLISPAAFAIDAAGSVWIVDPPSGLVKLTNDGQHATTYPLAGTASPDAIAIDQSGNLWLADAGQNAVVKVSSVGSILSGPGGFTGGGIAVPNQIAIDGAGNVWVASENPVVFTELDGSGNVISPANGYNQAAPNASYQAPYYGMVLDPSGNIWVSSSNGPIQLIGVAAPVLTPLAANLVAPNRPAQPLVDGPAKRD